MKLEDSKKYLKVVGAIVMIMGILSALFGVFVWGGALPENVVREAVQDNTELLKHSYYTIRAVFGLGIIISSFITIITGFMMWIVAKSGQNPVAILSRLSRSRFSDACWDLHRSSLATVSLTEWLASLASRSMF